MGGTIVFTCQVFQRGVLQWAVEGINTLSSSPGPVVFTVTGSEPSVATEIVELNSTLTNVEPNQGNPDIWNLTSELKIIVTMSNVEKHVYCSDGSMTMEMTIKHASKIIIIFWYFFI